MKRNDLLYRHPALRPVLLRSLVWRKVRRWLLRGGSATIDEHAGVITFNDPPPKDSCLFAIYGGDAPLETFINGHPVPLLRDDD